MMEKKLQPESGSLASGLPVLATSVEAQSPPAKPTRGTYADHGFHHVLFRIRTSQWRAQLRRHGVDVFLGDYARAEHAAWAVDDFLRAAQKEPELRVEEVKYNFPDASARGYVLPVVQRAIRRTLNKLARRQSYKEYLATRGQTKPRFTFKPAIRPPAEPIPADAMSLFETPKPELPAPWGGTHGYRNISRTGKLEKWRAHVRRHGVHVFLGDYDQDHEAAEAVDNFNYFARGTIVESSEPKPSYNFPHRYDNKRDDIVENPPPPPTEYTRAAIERAKTRINARGSRRARAYLSSHSLLELLIEPNTVI